MIRSAINEFVLGDALAFAFCLSEISFAQIPRIGRWKLSDRAHGSQLAPSWRSDAGEVQGCKSYGLSEDPHRLGQQSRIAQGYANQLGLTLEKLKLHNRNVVQSRPMK